MNRRRYLAAVSAGIASSGCLGGFGGVGATRLGNVSIHNRDEKSHTVAVQVFWDGDRVHDSSHAISADEKGDRRIPGALPNRTWPETAGQFRLRARLAGGEWHEIDPADSDYPDCYGVLIEDGPDGRLAIFTSTNPRECESESNRREDSLLS